jgi:hypothetical protein
VGDFQTLQAQKHGGVTTAEEEEEEEEEEVAARRLGTNRLHQAVLRQPKYCSYSANL